MVTEKLRERLNNGFEPFTIRLSDGRKFRVPHRDFIAVGSNVIVIIDKQDVSHTISPPHVVSIEEDVAEK